MIWVLHVFHLLHLLYSSSVHLINFNIQAIIQLFKQYCPNIGSIAIANCNKIPRVTQICWRRRPWLSKSVPRAERALEKSLLSLLQPPQNTVMSLTYVYLCTFEKHHETQCTKLSLETDIFLSSQSEVFSSINAQFIQKNSLKEAQHSLSKYNKSIHQFHLWTSFLTVVNSSFHSFKIKFSPKFLLLNIWYIFRLIFFSGLDKELFITITIPYGRHIASHPLLSSPI